MGFKENFFKKAASLEFRGHTFVLKGERVSLRPMIESDWAVVAAWETDLEVLYWADTDPVTSRTLEEVKGIFRTVSQTAYCFIVELNGKPIGDCWLQAMNVKKIIKKYPKKDCRRVDLVVGEKGLWGKGLGTDVIRTLTKFAFEHEKADMVFGIVGDYNHRSHRAFEKAGYQQVMKLKEPKGSRAKYCLALAVDKTAFLD
jgi:aminoglycoside 6'-N-acetyltransferase